MHKLDVAYIILKTNTCLEPGEFLLVVDRYRDWFSYRTQLEYCCTEQEQAYYEGGELHPFLHGG